jgi:hypothetical protein
MYYYFDITAGCLTENICKIYVDVEDVWKINTRHLSATTKIFIFSFVIFACSLYKRGQIYNIGQPAVLCHEVSKQTSNKINIWRNKNKMANNIFSNSYAHKNIWHIRNAHSSCWKGVQND